jgi:hypothetical protein
MSMFKLAASIALAAVLASTSLAQAGGLMFPQNRTLDGSGGGGGGGSGGQGPGLPGLYNPIRNLPQPGPGDQGGPGNNKPGPEFGDGDVTVASGPTLKLSPDSMSCAYKGDHFVQSGTPEIWLKNLSDAMILKGSIITVTWPDGTKTSFEIPFDLKPGASVGIAGPAGSDQPGFTAAPGSRWPTDRHSPSCRIAVCSPGTAFQGSGRRGIGPIPIHRSARSRLKP